MLTSSNPSLLIDARSASSITPTGYNSQWVTPVTGLFECVDSGRTYSSDYVDAMSDWLKMLWVDAVSDTTEVIQVETIRDRSDNEFVDDSVGSKRLTRSLVSPDPSVSILSPGTGPEPACVRLLDLGPDTLSDRDSLHTHGDMVAMNGVENHV